MKLSAHRWKWIDGVPHYRGKVMSDKTTEPVAFTPHKPCRTRSECRREGVCLDGWNCSHGERTTMAAAAPLPQTTPLPEGWRDIKDVITERESTPEGKAAMDAARARLPQTTEPHVVPHQCGWCGEVTVHRCGAPQTTPTTDEIMRLHDLAVSARFRELNEWPADPDGTRAALAAAVGRLAQNCAEWKQAAEHALSLAESNHERAEKAEAELERFRDDAGL